MLTEILIRELAIIEREQVSFKEGLNVITGETGAGKSIILDALELVLGARGNTGLIRSGAEQLQVDAHFDLSKVPEEILQSLPDVARGEELVVSRILNKQGKGKVYVNGNLGTVSLLTEVAQKLIHICGQSQHLQLLEGASYHIELLDTFAGLAKEKEDYRESYQKWEALEKRLEERVRATSQSKEREQELRGIVEEITPLEPKAGLRSDLESMTKRLGGAKRALELIQMIEEALSGDEGVLNSFKNLKGLFLELQKIDSGAGSVVGLLHEVDEGVSELSRELRRFGSSVVVDDTALQLAEERLSDLARVLRKYKTDEVGLVHILEKASSDLNSLANPESMDVLKAELEKAQAIMMEKGGKLSRIRKKSALQLEKMVASELEEVGMKGASLAVDIEGCHPRATGLEKIQFLVSTNKGDKAQPLKQVASGGELSRILLVLKKVLRDRSGINVLVFDEVDTGISGGTARAVGEKLRSLSELSQVICITHLAQVASLAHHHIKVEKVLGERAVAQVKALSRNERIEEIARMLSGHTVTEAARASAQELMR